MTRSWEDNRGPGSEKPFIPDLCCRFLGFSFTDKVFLDKLFKRMLHLGSVRERGISLVLVPKFPAERLPSAAAPGLAQPSFQMEPGLRGAGVTQHSQRIQRGLCSAGPALHASGTGWGSGKLRGCRTSPVLWGGSPSGQRGPAPRSGYESAEARIHRVLG